MAAALTDSGTMPVERRSGWRRVVHFVFRRDFGAVPSLLLGGAMLLLLVVVATAGAYLFGTDLKEWIVAETYCSGADCAAAVERGRAALDVHAARRANGGLCAESVGAALARPGGERWTIVEAHGAAYAVAELERLDVLVVPSASGAWPEWSRVDAWVAERAWDDRYEWPGLRPNCVEGGFAYFRGHDGPWPRMIEIVVRALQAGVVGRR